MCGFSVIIERGGAPVHAATITRMNDAVAHRGPDASGVALFGSIGLGHRRLSIIDPGAQADQPMARAGGALVFNGEIYNFAEVRRELEALGDRFETRSDTEVLLAALDRWWTDALPRLNGMFAFAYLDHRHDRLLLARDRFGVKPLFWTEQGGRIVAGSEIKQAFVVEGIRPAVDEASARAFLLDAALDRSDATMFSHVNQLRGGHYAIYERSRDRFTLHRWYDLAARVVPDRPSYGEARERVGALVEDAVRLRHIANVPLGACLSGGVDSSVICAVSASVVTDPAAFTVFTTYHDVAGFDEREFSRLVAEKFGFRSIELRPDLASLFAPGMLEELAWHQDGPLPSGSHYNEYLIFKAARAHGVTVVLDGQGADEYFGGYGEFWFAAQIEALRAGDIKRFRDGIAGRADATGRSSARTLYMFLRGLARRPAAEPAWITAARSGAQPSTARPRDFRALALDEMTRTSLPYQLHSEDRNSMRWSVEARMPMTDYRLVEYAMGLPTEYKIGDGFQKRVLREAISSLPQPIARRRGKMGFVSADVDYMFGAAPLAREMIDAAATRLGGRIDRALVLEDFDAIIAGKRPYHDGIFRLISFDAWARAFGVTL